MVGYLIHAIAELKAGDLYETAAELYKLLLPIYEKNINYEQISATYGELQALYSTIVECVSLSFPYVVPS